MGPTNQHTLGHVLCPACDEIRATLLSNISAEMDFDRAADVWLALRSLDGAGRYIRKTTEVSYRQYAASLSLFFGKMALGKICWFHLRAYQKARLEGSEPFIRKRRPHDKDAGPCPAKPKKVNQELGVLKTILIRAGCWRGELSDLYQPILDDGEEIARALSPEEQRRWLDIARMYPRWQVVYLYSLLAFHTCMSTDEIRGLRIGDINLFQRVVSVPRKSSKNRHRSRTIELVGAEVLWALEKLLERAERLGARDPQHYLFPFRAAIDHWDASRPMTVSGIKAMWNEVRAASDLNWFRQYDCRHTAITRLAESGVPIDIIMARAGHVSEKMRRHYTHVSVSAQRKWMEHSISFQDAALNKRPPSVVGRPNYFQKMS